MIDLRRLKALRVLHDVGTVTAAARALHLTPSAVSQQLRQLSVDLGVPLLERDGRQVRLTPAAQVVIGHADVMARQWQQLRADLAAHEHGETGSLRICSFATGIAPLVVPAVSEMGHVAPRVHVQITEAETVADSFDQLTTGETDVAVLAPLPDSPPVDDPRFDQQVLCDDPQDLVVWSSHPYADRETVRLEELSSESWIAPQRDQHRLITSACAAAGYAPRVEHHADDWNAVMAMVASGLGVCLMPRLASTALPSAPSFSLRRVPVEPGSCPPRRILTAVRAGSREHPVITIGLRALANACGSGTL